MQITTDFSKPIRPVGKLNGTNNGPLNAFTDRTEEFRDLGVDFVRFHETHSNTAKCIEIPFIFRDFDADENDPANYYFDETDAVITAAVKENIEIMYRLGMGTERPSPKIWLKVPADFQKWARIVCRIMDHYNRGWAEGFHYGIRYWEVWNEADLLDYWPAARSLFTEFYCTVAPMLKNHDPEALIGPCGFAWFYRPNVAEDFSHPENLEHRDRRQFYKDFLRRVRDEKIPMDFFAYHTYANSTAVIEERLSVIEDLLKTYGFYGNTEIINTEWNAVRLDAEPSDFCGAAWDVSQAMNPHNAINCISTMLIMQHHGVTKAGYYDADDKSSFCGLYGFDGSIRPMYYSLKSFKMLREGETEVYTSPGNARITACASYNGKKGVILVTNEGLFEQVKLDIKNLPACEAEYYLFDSAHKLECVKKEAFTGEKICLAMGTDSAYVIVFTQEKTAADVQ